MQNVKQQNLILTSDFSSSVKVSMSFTPDKYFYDKIITF